MNRFASLFFLVSDSLLWPVMLGLALGLVLALWRCGATLRLAFERARDSKRRARVADALRRNQLDAARDALGSAPFRDAALATIAELFDARDDPALLDAALADARNRDAERATTVRVLMKLGPAFGLMGTLIPLGPALVGLATGDLETLARNLTIAFATTVVGLAASSLAFLVAAALKRFANRDAILTTFAATRILDARDAEKRNAKTKEETP